MAKPTYSNGDIVYLKTDEEQYPYLITGIILRPEEYFEYFISDGVDEILVRDVQISSQKQIVFN